MARLFPLLTLLLLPGLSLGGGTVGGQETEVQVYTLMMEGIQAYEAGDFETAIGRYGEALELNPGNALILYERAMAYLSSGQYDLCIRDAESGLELGSTNDAGLLSVLGNCLSDKGDSEEAIGTFEQGLERFPENIALNFNIALALARNGDPDRARSHLKTTLEIAPDYPSANVLLGQLYQAGGYRIPAIYQYLRFVSSELLTERSTAIGRVVLELINAGSEPTNDADDSDTRFPNPTDEEGDFADIEMMLARISGPAITDSESNAERSPAADAVATLENAVAITRQSAGEELHEAWIWKHAVSFLLDLEDAGHLETLGYIAFADLEGARGWIEENSGSVERFLIWREEALSTP